MSIQTAKLSRQLKYGGMPKGLQDAFERNWYLIESALNSVGAVTPGTSVTPPTLGVTDHGELTGLTDDDHLQYLLLAGRSGGQVIANLDIADIPLTVNAIVGQTSAIMSWKKNLIEVMSLATDGRLNVYGSITPRVSNGSVSLNLTSTTDASEIQFKNNGSAALRINNQVNSAIALTIGTLTVEVGNVTINPGNIFVTAGSIILSGASQAVRVASTGGFQFINNTGSSFVNALLKDTSDRLQVGSTGISDIFIKPANTLVATFNASGITVPSTITGSIIEHLLTGDGDGTGPGIILQCASTSGLGGGVRLALSGGNCELIGTLSTGRVIIIPDQSGTLMLTGNKYGLLGSISSVFDSNTASSGSSFADTGTTSKKLRMVLSGAVGNNSLNIISTAARDYKTQDYGSSFILGGNTTSASGVLGKSSLAAQAGNIAAQTLLTASANSSGKYRITFYVKTTTAGAALDVVKFTVAFNDGAAQAADVLLTELVATPVAPLINHDLATLNKSTFGSVIVKSAASQAITWTSTVTKTGAPQYSVDVGIEALPG